MSQCCRLQTREGDVPRTKHEAESAACADVLLPLALRFPFCTENIPRTSGAAFKIKADCALTRSAAGVLQGCFIVFWSCCSLCICYNLHYKETNHDVGLICSYKAFLFYASYFWTIINQTKGQNIWVEVHFLWTQTYLLLFSVSIAEQ